MFFVRTFKKSQIFVHTSKSTFQLPNAYFLVWMVTIGPLRHKNDIKHENTGLAWVIVIGVNPLKTNKHAYSKFFLELSKYTHLPKITKNIIQDFCFRNSNTFVYFREENQIDLNMSSCKGKKSSTSMLRLSGFAGQLFHLSENLILNSKKLKRKWISQFNGHQLWSTKRRLLDKKGLFSPIRRNETIYFFYSYVPLILSLVVDRQLDFLYLVKLAVNYSSMILVSDFNGISIS